jgi:hypothetical protein
MKTKRRAKEIPAPRLGIADRKYSIEDIIYFGITFIVAKKVFKRTKQTRLAGTNR